jgi:hypothetical protein
VTLARLIGLMLAPIGVIVLGWAIAQMVEISPAGGGWVAPGMGLGFGGAAIIVAARYLLKPRAAPGGEGDGGA